VIAGKSQEDVIRHYVKSLPPSFLRYGYAYAPCSRVPAKAPDDCID